MDWKGILFIVAVVAAWFVLNRFVLPRCGISTCCSPAACPTATANDAAAPAPDQPVKPIEQEEGNLP